MEQSLTWEANRFAASQEVSRILWNPKIQYLIHNSPPPEPARSSPQLHIALPEDPS